ncbi:hypothetical protein HY772_04975 [Candidatus Woesearchaeota archaeon]|nr:hypothetical protein [Candidatus Woesearchaeota archaeon]
MPDRTALYDRLGAKALTAPAKPGLSAAGARPPTPLKPFDINLYFKAAGMAFDDFFNKRLSYFFKNPWPVLKKSPDWFTKLPNDEKATYGVLLLGNILVIVGIVLFFVL